MQARYDGTPVTIAAEETHMNKTMYKLAGALSGWVFADDEKLEVDDE